MGFAERMNEKWMESGLHGRSIQPTWRVVPDTLDVFLICSCHAMNVSWFPSRPFSGLTCFSAGGYFQLSQGFEKETVNR